MEAIVDVQRYEQQVASAEYCKLMQELELGIPTNQTELDLLEADTIKIYDTGPVMHAAGNRIELVPLFPKTGRGGPVFNFRSGGRRFADNNRCLIPTSAFFEFTGKKYPKAKHRFTSNNVPFLAITGIRREGRDGTAALGC